MTLTEAMRPSPRQQRLVEQSGRGDGDGNNVIAERPDEVLANCGEGGAAQGDGLRDLRDIAVKQGNVSGLDRATSVPVLAAMPMSA